ncbi:MAG: ATP-dependent zinc metalloprotease FtsH [Bacteroidales bacterium]|nr:ATP-dependent zinc metalloprotease FtsH [Bacteroidaceae bacterium]MBR3609813.1 ATP-dependent zinc metalloprotease FtsH [Bacteroidales bacterium]
MSKKGGFKISLYWVYSLIAIALIVLYYKSDDSVSKEVPWSTFEEIAKNENNGIKTIKVFRNSGTLEAVLTDSLGAKVFEKDITKVGKNPTLIVNIPSADNFSESASEWKKENNFNVPITYDDSSDFSDILWGFGPILLLVVFWIFIMRKMSGGGGGGNGGVFNVGKAKAQVFDKNGPIKVTFNDVAGLSEAKQEVEEIVDFLKNPKKYTVLGGKIPKGALLVGPPGTGKTLLAKAVAGEANVPFLSLSGSDFVEMFVGVGASRVRDLFKQAKEKAPCIVFIDEIDAVGRARGKNVGMGSNEERENTLNQLLTEMDGFGSNSGVIVLAATNRVDILDKALLRAGRFDRQIYIELPELNDRKAIFNVHLRGVKIDESVDVDLLARQTPGFSGADIANVCNEAALIAARRNKKEVSRQDFMDAVDRIIGGLEKRGKITTEEEKRSIAIHEAGHATLSWWLQYANPLVKVTIVPRGKALGAAWYLPEERKITTLEQIQDEICAILGGRAAEELFIGKISTGAANDLERVTKQAYALVTYFGMSPELPNISYYDSSGQGYGFTKPYSEDTAKLIDKEVNRLIAEQYARAKKILLEKAEGHHALTSILLEREVIFTEDVEKIFGKRQWSSRTEEIMEAEEKRLEDEKRFIEEKSSETSNSCEEEKSEEKNVEEEEVITNNILVEEEKTDSTTDKD